LFDFIINIFFFREPMFFFFFFLQICNCQFAKTKKSNRKNKTKRPQRRGGVHARGGEPCHEGIPLRAELCVLAREDLRDARDGGARLLIVRLDALDGLLGLGHNGLQRRDGLAGAASSESMSSVNWQKKAFIKARPE
jgi:hypothetical protein